MGDPINRTGRHAETGGREQEGPGPESDPGPSDVAACEANHRADLNYQALWK